MFRGKFLHALSAALAKGALRLAGSTGALADSAAQRGLLESLRAKPWVVYAKHTLAGPEQVLDYLGRYVQRVAISNERLLGFDDAAVRFRWRDRAHGNRRTTMRLLASEFLERFLLHVLPSGFMRIRHYGLLANRRKRALLATARAALDAPAPDTPHAPETVHAFCRRVLGLDIARCPACRTGTLHPIGSLAPQFLYRARPP